MVYLGQCRPEGDFRICKKKFKLVGTIYGTLEFESGEPIILNLKNSRLELVATIVCENPDAPYRPSPVPPFMQGDRVRLMYYFNTCEVAIERDCTVSGHTNEWCAQPVFW